MATRWSPDTCKCVLVYDAAGQSGKLTAVTIENACHLHSDAGTTAQSWSKKRAQDHLELVLAHNRSRPDKLENG